MDDRIIETDTHVSRVTFFEDRAEVVRVAHLRVPGGRSRVHARGITLLVDDRSLTCAAPGVELVSCRIRRRAEEAIAVDAIAALEAERERARSALAALDFALSSATADARRTGALMQAWGGAVSAVPSRAEAAVAELSRAYDALDTCLRENLDVLARLRRQREDAQAELGRIDARLGQARMTRPRFEAFAEIEIVAASETQVDLAITYRTPCALWRPEHLARLVDGTMTVTTYATVWQCTGEVWKDISCRFSTSRPAKSATAPHLREDVLFTRKKTDVERRQLIVEARDQAVATAGIARGKRDLDEMPGVEDGGEAQWLTARSSATIESDGRPVRIEVGERTVPCTVARVCFPELGPATHFRATATLAGPTPLLAGPVMVARQTEIVGRSKVGFVGVGEPFELGFGVDDGLRVRRRVVEKRKTTQLTGTQHVSREVCLFVSNLSGELRTLSIVERVPVSEVEDVQIELEPQPQMRHDARNGFATFEIELPPRATRDLVLTYRIEAKSNVVLPTLDAS